MIPNVFFSWCKFEPIYGFLSIQLIDIIPIMQINMVWCYFMMQDISSLSEAGKLLAKAREGLEDAYGKHALRARLLKSGCFLELAW